MGGPPAAGQRVAWEPAQDERVDPDLAQPPAGLERREDRGNEQQRATLLVADPLAPRDVAHDPMMTDRTGEGISGSTGSTGSAGMGDTSPVRSDLEELRTWPR